MRGLIECSTKPRRDSTAPSTDGAFCPDCGQHNSRQILDKNLELAGKQLALASQLEPDLAAQLVADALENGVSAFDGFGREICRVFASKATDLGKAEKTTFQNLLRAQENVQKLFGFDLAAGLDTAEWTQACRCFQKRHLIAHKMGIVDDAYINATADPQAVVGRKIAVDTSEVEALIGMVKKLGVHLTAQLQKLS